MIPSLIPQNFISNSSEISRTPDVPAKPQPEIRLTVVGLTTNVARSVLDIHICISCREKLARAPFPRSDGHTIWKKFAERLIHGRTTSYTQIRRHHVARGDAPRTLTQIRRNKKRNYVAYSLHYRDAINFRCVHESTATCSRWNYMIDNGRSYRMIG